MQTQNAQIPINTNEQQELRTITTDGITTTCKLCVRVSVRSTVHNAFLTL